MNDDVFDKLRERIDYMENIYGAELSSTWFNTAEECDLERSFCKKEFKWTKKNK